MFINILALAFILFAFIAAFKMDTFLQGFLFIVAIGVVCGVLFLFISFPGLSGLSVALMMAAFIFRQNKK
ncbi:membrane associated rhomboid family serine protease [Pedobacter sp. AK017]|uniref:Uncharacterized protein n=1 Tax=Pedobacter heparinus (strain ATCC 13125 / DSM 2366 / CIP 104194 / JCM 7457 / NBRC 12017 / NCIMB 9290 / NRRL B-14731 / HIM 762-3) TaxID=485917 RepID=C6XYI9_PEDHD|nr:hypothetical protein Phep_2267 [Pedobacter heparinus DSM 2366]MBB5437673.1 membrane associated rhomboid family serine protease [Pedobacter sp. AK017]